MDTLELSDPNIVLKSVADLLVTDKEADDFEKKYLEKNTLDYSIESLQYIDSYLDKARSKKKELNQEQYLVIILRCGAYVGEVLRNIADGFSWLNFEDALTNHPDISSYGKSLLTLYPLEDKETKALLFPMVKVEKFLSNGKQDSLYLYGKVIKERFGKK